MADLHALPPYPEPPKTNVEGTWVAGGQGQYAPQPYMSAGGPVYVVQHTYIDPSINQIRDWLPWSIVNMFIGWILGGILPLIFSLICRSHKRSNNAQGARTMSTLALIFNILVTLGGLAGWIGLIVGVVTLSKAVTLCINYPYCY